MPTFLFCGEGVLDIAGRVEGLVRDTVEGQGLEFVHVEFEPKGGSPVLRVLIDKEGGVSLSDCSETSRHLSVLLDVEDVIPGHYVLEVSSPGLERPLFKEEDYRRFIGEEIRLRAKEKVEGRKNFVGNIRDCAGGVLQVECEGRLYTIPFQRIKRANLVYRFK